MKRLFDFARGDKRMRDESPLQWRTTIIFTVAVTVATGALVWFAYVATREWKRGTELVHQRSASEALALTDAALSRDMTGAWKSLLAPMDQPMLRETPPYELLERTARTFARFPYPESFIVWSDDTRNGLTYVFNRSERQPRWYRSRQSDDPFPVTLVRDAPSAKWLLDAVQRHAHPGIRFVTFEEEREGVQYQVLAHLMFTPTAPYVLAGFAAFTVNIDWVRSNYFGPLLTQIAKIGGIDDLLRLEVRDHTATTVAATGPGAPDRPSLDRSFPLVFVDPAVLSRDTTTRTAIPEWSLRVSESPTSGLRAAAAGADRVLALMAFAAVASIAALVQTIRALRASALVTAMKSDFVAAVTHELKTPIAVVRLVADTLAQGRYSSPDSVREYAKLLSQESQRLTHSVDYLLTYARYAESGATDSHDREPMDLADLVDDALDHFRPALAQRQGRTSIDVSCDLPRVHVDGRAVKQAIETLIDNAIKYSTEAPVLSLTARATDTAVTLTVADSGIGIHKDDLSHVCDRFYRGRNALHNGSGLGLAITRRIMRHHGGDVEIRSTLGAGTEVQLVFPRPRP